MFHLLESGFWGGNAQDMNFASSQVVCGNPRVITVGEVIAEIEQKAAAKQAMEKKAKPKAKAKK